MAEKKLVRVIEVFMVAVPKSDKSGRPAIVVAAGDIYASDDPLVKRYPEKFEPVDGKVERATANPGEVRAVSVPKSDD